MADTTEETVTREAELSSPANDISNKAALMGVTFGFWLLVTLCNVALLVHAWSTSTRTVFIISMVGTTGGFIATFGTLFGFIGWLVGLHMEASCVDEKPET